MSMMVRIRAMWTGSPLGPHVAARMRPGYIALPLSSHDKTASPVQYEKPDAVYPLLHVGWQSCPAESRVVQLPTPPFVGGSCGMVQFAVQQAHVSNQVPGSNQERHHIPHVGKECVPAHVFTCPQGRSGPQNLFCSSLLCPHPGKSTER